MTTKQKILQSALELYNEFGVFNALGEKKITAREIAATVGISDGNLRYHFRTREDIIYALYLQLVEKLNHLFISFIEHPPSITFVYHSLEKTYELLYTYRFLMLDFVAVMRKIPKIKMHFQQLTNMRSQQMSALIGQLVEAELLAPPQYPNQYESFISSFQLISDFWISSAEILYQGPDSNRLKHYVQLNFALIFPYLTPKGIVEYEKIQASM